MRAETYCLASSAGILRRAHILYNPSFRLLDLLGRLARGTKVLRRLARRRQFGITCVYIHICIYTQHIYTHMYIRGGRKETCWSLHGFYNLKLGLKTDIYKGDVLLGPVFYRHHPITVNCGNHTLGVSSKVHPTFFQKFGGPYRINGLGKCI